jgi:hypothetical protein
VRTLTTLAAAALAAVALPSGAVAQTAATGSDCAYTSDAETRIATVPHVVVYVESGGDAGMTGQADAAGGVCTNGLGITTPVNHLDGFTLEAGADLDGEVYAIGDGDNHNTDIRDVTDGYGGVSTYETGNKGSCDAPPGTGSNSGGCFTLGPIQDVVRLPLPIACGNRSGNTWSNTARDGCVVG